jgi:Tol biopolymer transport system component
MLFALAAFGVAPARSVQLEPLTSFQSNPNDDSEAAWSPDGTVIFFVRVENICGPYHYCYEPNLYVTTLWGDATRLWQAGGYHPSIGRGGIIVVSGAGDTSSIYVQRPRSSTVTLTSGPYADHEPVLSSDGTRVAFASNRSGAMHIWIVPIAGGAPVQLTDGPGHDSEPAWSSDGGRIAFASTRGGSSDLWVVQASGGAPVQITDDPAEDSHPSWSPDGKLLAFASTRSGNRDIWVVSIDKGTFSQVTTRTVDDTEPVWSPDGERIAFTSGGLIWLATDLRTVAVAHMSWSDVKIRYR